jgi:hypothetical protein
MQLRIDQIVVFVMVALASYVGSSVKFNFHWALGSV